MFAIFARSVVALALVAVLLSALVLDTVAADDLRVEASRVAHFVAFASGSTYYGASPDKFERPHLVSPTVDPIDYSRPYANDGTSVTHIDLCDSCQPRRRFGAYLPDNSYVYANDGTRIMSVGNPRNPQHFVTFRGLYSSGWGPWGWGRWGWWGGYVRWATPFYAPYPSYGPYFGSWYGGGI